MLCHQLNCIFVHIPKSAGQSVEHVVLRELGLTWEQRGAVLMLRNRRPELGPPRLAHLKAAEYLQYGHVTEDQFASYFKFSFVRNPWDRAVSMYKYIGRRKGYDFKTFLFKDLAQESWRKRQWFVEPQTAYVYDTAGRLLVDFVGRFEALQTDFDQICDRLGIAETKLPHVNRSVAVGPTLGWHPTSLVNAGLFKARILVRTLLQGESSSPSSKRYEDFYDTESRELIAKLYRSDIDTFGYSFDRGVQAEVPRRLVAEQGRPTG